MELSTLSLLDSVLPHSKPQRVVWREVVPLTEDPDQPFNLRLKLAAQAGIGLAAGVRFHFRGTQGLVVYMARGECFQLFAWHIIIDQSLSGYTNPSAQKMNTIY